MADLEVDVEALEELARTLDRIRVQLDATRRVMDAYEEHLGSGRVLDALDHFAGRWSAGRKTIDAGAATLSSMATESAKAYRQAGEELRSSLERSREGSSA